jgi:cysteine desulfurase
MEPSHVLLAIGQPPELAYGSLRLTLCAENTQAEIDYLIHAVSEAVLKLRRKSFGECSIHL